MFFIFLPAVFFLSVCAVSIIYLLTSTVTPFSLSLTLTFSSLFTSASSSDVSHFFSPAKATTLFRKQTKAIVWGMQTRAVQGMLDFDYVCSRDDPSVTAMVYPFT